MPRRQRSFESVIRSAVEVLRRNRIDYVFVGGLSVVIFGIPRTTSDVDVLVHLAAKKLRAVRAEAEIVLENEGLSPPAAAAHLTSTP